MKYTPSTSISTNHKIDYWLKFQVCFVIRQIALAFWQTVIRKFAAGQVIKVLAFTQHPVWLYSLFVKSWNVSVYWFIMSALHLGLQQSKSNEYNKCFSAHYERNFIISIPLIMTINIFSWNRDQVADKPFKKCSRQKKYELTSR